MKLTVITLIAALALAGCNKPQRSFADEDACEAAGMSDAFCDSLFPEAEDYFGKKKKAKPVLKSSTPKSKPYSSRARVFRKK